MAWLTAHLPHVAAAISGVSLVAHIPAYWAMLKAWFRKKEQAAASFLDGLAVNIKANVAAIQDKDLKAAGTQVLGALYSLVLWVRRAYPGKNAADALCAELVTAYPQAAVVVPLIKPALSSGIDAAEAFAAQETAPNAPLGASPQAPPAP